MCCCVVVHSNRTIFLSNVVNARCGLLTHARIVRSVCVRVWFECVCTHKLSLHDRNRNILRAHIEEHSKLPSAACKSCGSFEESMPRVSFGTHSLIALYQFYLRILSILGRINRIFTTTVSWILCEEVIELNAGSLIAMSRSWNCVCIDGSVRIVGTCHSNLNYYPGRLMEKNDPFF